MADVIVKDGLQKFLMDWAEQANSDGYLIGLFQYPWTGDFDSDIDSIVPCDFGGYSGQQTLDQWDGPGVTLLDPRAILLHPEVIWTADGTSTNMVGGYYVTTSYNTLLYVVPRDAGSETIGAFDGQTYTAHPSMRMRTEVV